MDDFRLSQAIKSRDLIEVSQLMGGYAAQKNIEINEFHKPDFIIIGSTKCGTSSLYNYLTQHPNVQERNPKELHFFTQFYEHGIEFYRNYFYEKKNMFLMGEASPSYFDQPTKNAHLKIKEHLPDAKIFLLLRNPIQRTISVYYHILRAQKNVPLGFDFVDNSTELNIEKLRTTQLSGTIEAGKYIQRLDKWKATFGNNLKIINSDDLKTSKEDVLNASFKFLGLSKLQNLADREFTELNVNKYPPVDQKVMEYLYEIFYPYNEALFNETGINFN